MSLEHWADKIEDFFNLNCYKDQRRIFNPSAKKLKYKKEFKTKTNKKVSEKKCWCEKEKSCPWLAKTKIDKGVVVWMYFFWSEKVLAFF